MAATGSSGHLPNHIYDGNNSDVEEIGSANGSKTNPNVSNGINNSQLFSATVIKVMLDESTAESRKVETITKNGVARSVNSKIWDTFFQIYEIESNTNIPGWYQCMACKEPVENKYTGGTTIKFHRHIEKCSKKDLQQQTLDQYFNNVVQPTKISKTHADMLKNAAVQFVCEDLRPYCAIEGNGLFNLVSAAMELGKKYPNITSNDLKCLLPARNTVQRAVTLKASDAKAMIKSELHEAYSLAGSFACTADLWSDSYRQNSYLGVTAHINLMDQHKIIPKRFVLSHIEIEEDCKTREVIETHLFKILMEYGFNREQIQNNIYFVTDRGPNFKALKNIHRANCFAHMTNNTVQAVCNEKKLKTMLSDAKSLVKYMKRTGMDQSGSVNFFQ